MSTPALVVGKRPRGDKVRGTLFYVLLLVSVSIGFVLLGTLVVDVIRKGVGYVDPVLFTEPTSTNPERAGAGPAIRGPI